MSKGLIALAVLVALAGIVLFSSVYTVHQTQQALLLQFGAPQRIDTEPGIHFKIPFVQDVVPIEKRILALDIEPDNAFAWYQLSFLHDRNGDTALAQLAVAEQAYATGDEMRAYQFAMRARDGLEQGTPAWFRATEIQAVAQPSEEEMREMRRRQRQRMN